LDIARFLQIYVIQGAFVLFFLFMAYKTLKRGRKQVNMYLSCFYLCTSIAGTINIVYANIFEEIIVYILHFITYFILCLSLIFLLIFVLVLIIPENKINLKIQFIIIIGFVILVLIQLAIPNGITINATTNWKPNWAWGFFFYSIVICSVFTVFPTTFYSLKIYSKLENEYLKKKWKFFLAGVFAYFFLYYGTSLSNTLNDDVFRIIWSLLSLPTLISLYLIYHGVGKQLD